VTEPEWKTEGDLAEMRDRITLLEVRYQHLGFILICAGAVLLVVIMALVLLVLGTATA
jgi:hypothetical protein